MSLYKTAAALMRTLPAEAAHKATIKSLKLGLGPVVFKASQPELAVQVGGLSLPNPVGLAAGFDKNAEVPGAMLAAGFGFVECGTVTPRPQPGNPKPRLFRLSEDQGVINRLGFNNHGLDYFVRRLRRAPVGTNCPVGANVGANKTSADFIADYEAGIAAVYPFCSYITINISSPNTPGLRGLQNKDALQELLERCETAASTAQSAFEDQKPVFLKVAPDLDAAQLLEIVDTMRTHGAWLSGLIISGSNQRPNVMPRLCTWSISGVRPSGYLRGSTSQSDKLRVSSSRWPNQPSSSTKRSAPSLAARSAMSFNTGSL